MEHERTVVTIDRGSAPRIFWFGEDFLLEDLPPGTRVIYPRKPLQPLRDPMAAIRYAINHPEGSDPLFALLKPGMKVTIALDDISLPLPQMVLPDIRERILNVVLPLLAEYGVEDIHLIVATAFHRRMTPSEMERMVGSKIFKEFYPDRYYNHDGEDEENMVYLGTTEKNEVVKLSRRAVESDLVIYVNINLVPMDGGHKSVAVGLSGYESLKAHHNPYTMLQVDSFMDPEKSELNNSVYRQGQLVKKHMNVFTIETVLNTNMFGPGFEFLAKNEDEFTDGDWLKFRSMKWALSKLPRAARREIFMRVPAPYGLIGVNAGETEKVHAKTLERSYQQYLVPVEGQADVLMVGIPFISPYNVNSILNPILVQVMAMGYLFNSYKGKALLRKGGVMIITHPCTDEFHPDHHPSYIEFFHRLLPETRDSRILHKKYEAQFAKDPSYMAMYRKGHAYHGVHPFYMWYWGEKGRSHVGRVIVVGAEQPYVTDILGWEHAATLSEALDMAKDTVGPSPQLTMMHYTPIMMAQVT
ncbi:MAG: lactate racemase domain-containing protein [Myxococcota bacterium]